MIWPALFMSRIISFALLHFLYEKTARVNKHTTQKLWDLPKNSSWSHRVCQPEHICVLLWLDREWIKPRTVWVQHCSSAPWVWEGIFFGRGFSSSPDAKPKARYKKPKQLLFRTISRLVFVQRWVCSRVLCVVLGEAFHTQAGKF